MTNIPIKFEDGVDSAGVLNLEAVSPATVPNGFYRSTSESIVMGNNGTVRYTNGLTGAHTWFDNANTTLASISNAGTLVLGNSGAQQHSIRSGINSNYALKLSSESATGPRHILMDFPNLSTGTVISMLWTDGADGNCGSISVNTDANTTSFTTTSDMRLKTDLGSWSGIDLISGIIPRKYERDCDKGVVEYGYFAQELHEVVPQAVFVGDEDLTVEGAVPWGIDYGKVTAITVKAIQEQQAIIETLLARIEALESK